MKYSEIIHLSINKSCTNVCVETLTINKKRQIAISKKNARKKVVNVTVLQTRHH